MPKHCGVIYQPLSLSLSLFSMDKDSQDVHQELAKLKAKIHEAREQVTNMPGINSTPLEQQQQLATLQGQVRTKNQLLQKYKSLCMFDAPKASWDKDLITALTYTNIIYVRTQRGIQETSDVFCLFLLLFFSKFHSLAFVTIKYLVWHFFSISVFDWIYLYILNITGIHFYHMYEF